MSQYARAHWKVSEERGPATDYRCITCADPAVDWAYQHDGNGDEFYSEEGWPFSTSVHDYEPMCRSCHRKLDMWHWTREFDKQVKLLQKAVGDEQMGHRRRKCKQCDLVSHPAGIGRHQKASGHSGYEEGDYNMRVNLYETVEVSDAQRAQIADLLDKKVTKRLATRDEIKAFVWEEGEYWAGSLEALHRNFVKGESGEADEDVDTALANNAALHDGLSADELDDLI